jgi:hypothetical protein
LGLGVKFTPITTKTIILLYFAKIAPSAGDFMESSLSK